jgi:hypothetical protein
MKPPIAISSHEAFSIFEGWKEHQQVLHVISSIPPAKFEVMIGDVLPDSESLILAKRSTGATIEKAISLRGANFDYVLSYEDSSDPILPSDTWICFLSVWLSGGGLLLFGKHV